MKVTDLNPLKSRRAVVYGGREGSSNFLYIVRQDHLNRLSWSGPLEAQTICGVTGRCA